MNKTFSKRSTQVAVALLGSLALTGCGVSKYQFQASKTADALTEGPKAGSGVIDIAPAPGETPAANDYSIRVKDKRVALEFNQPVDFQLGSEAGEWVLRLSDSDRASLEVVLKDVANALGEVTVLDAAAHKYRFTPQRGFRGEFDVPFTVRTKSGTIASNEARIQFMIGSSVQTLKPALAVRATGCIMCHSNVKANIITDFGFGGDGAGNDYFFGKNQGGLSPHAGSIYGDHSENWSSANVVGKIIVPKARIPAAAGPDASLADYLRGTQGTRAGVTVEEQERVYIGAPKAESFLQAAGDFPTAHPNWKFIPHSQESAPISAFVEKSNYIEITGDKPFVCNGDLVLKKPLVFRGSVKIQTDDNGCRIYSSGTIFVQGAIEYPGTAPLRNLQLMSARAILMGLGQSLVGPTAEGAHTSNSIEDRFQVMWTAPGLYKRGLSVADANSAILADARAVDGLLDANSLPGGRAVAFSRLLLVAPEVDSRFQGDVSGTIVAEIAMFSLNAFKFTFDEVFSKAPVFPLVRSSEYLIVGVSAN